MRQIPSSLLISIVLVGGIRQSDAQDTQIIGRAISRDGDLFVSFDQPDPDYDIAGDMFGIRSRDMPDAPDCLTCPGLPPAIIDQTFDLFDPSPRDKLGIIRSEDADPFFGVVDTANDVGERLNSASWTFDVAGYTDLRLSADMAAMGDFEAGDIERGTRDAFAFDYAIDGGPFEFLFVSSVDTEASLVYQMELPDPDSPVITIDDPLAMGGVTLNNVFQTLSADVPGSGSLLELRFRTIADGADEVFAFRNLLIEGTPDGPPVTFPEGDYNASGLVEQADLDLVLGNWGAEAANVPATWLNDPPTGIVDQAELDKVLGNWGATAASAISAAFGSSPAVPEPATLALVSAAIASACGLHLFRPRRRTPHSPA